MNIGFRILPSPPWEGPACLVLVPSRRLVRKSIFSFLWRALNKRWRYSYKINSLVEARSVGIFHLIFIKESSEKWCCLCVSGLPDFSWHNIPKWGCLNELPQHVPNCHEIKQMATKYTK
jgi:hypothetical protein